MILKYKILLKSTALIYLRKVLVNLKIRPSSCLATESWEHTDMVCPSLMHTMQKVSWISHIHIRLKKPIDV